MRTTLALISLLLVLALAACGNDDDDDNVSNAPSGDAPAEAPPAQTPPTDTGPAPESPDKPEVEVPDEPAEELESEDIKKGDGDAAKAGDTVSVHYVGVAQSTGKEFDASYGSEPFEFELGAGSVIPGWDEGVQGMKVGGRRRLVIPGDQAYGPEGQPPDIGPDETLVFVIDLLEVK